MPERRTVAAKGITRRETEGARVTWMSCRTYRGPRRKRKGIIGQTSKPTLLGSDVVALVYNFTQRCFIGEEGSSDVDLSHELGLVRRLESGPISQVEAHQLPQGQRRLFRELLIQYIMFLEMNRELPFPPDFLSDSTEDQLGTNILEYICHHRWPFPQTLPK